jgi:circadian clock protein KaiB
MLLFVAGDEKTSRAARSNMQSICDRHLNGQSCVEVVDVLRDYKKAIENRVLITPTLLVLEPEPAVRIVGTLEDTDRVLSAICPDNGSVEQ